MSLAAALLIAIAASGRVPAGEDAVTAERFDTLIESLNAASGRRGPVLEAIYNELRGPAGREMQEALRGAMFRGNNLILLGAAEAMAMLGDARDVPHLEALLATSGSPEVKEAVIRLLPAFALSSERTRFNYIHYAAGYERTARPEVLEPLRKPPLSRRGRLDALRERLLGDITRCIARQFDPVGAALRYIDDILYSQAARSAVTHFVGDGLGNDPGRWAGIWAAQGRDMDLRTPDEVEEIRLVALRTLSDMGAEGLPEVIDAFTILFAAGGEVLPQAALETMTAMCRTAFAEYPSLSSMNFSAEDAAQAENWRRRRHASTANLAAYAAETAGGMLRADVDAAVFTAAAGCLGAALSYPPDYPDPGLVLAGKRQAGLARLESMVMMPDISREKRTAVVMALGEIGAERAVRAIASIIDSPYCSPGAGIEGSRMAEAAIDALRTAATGIHAGRDAARTVFLGLLEDRRVFPPLRAGTPPVGLAYMALWRLQRLAKSNDTSLDAALWRGRLGW